MTTMTKHLKKLHLRLGVGKLCNMTEISSLNASETTDPSMKEQDLQNVLLAKYGFLSVDFKNCN